MNRGSTNAYLGPPRPLRLGNNAPWALLGEVVVWKHHVAAEWMAHVRLRRVSSSALGLRLHTHAVVFTILPAMFNTNTRSLLSWYMSGASTQAVYFTSAGATLQYGSVKASSFESQLQGGHSNREPGIWCKHHADIRYKPLHQDIVVVNSGCVVQTSIGTIVKPVQHISTRIVNQWNGK